LLTTLATGETAFAIHPIGPGIDENDEAKSPMPPIILLKMSSSLYRAGYTSPNWDEILKYLSTMLMSGLHDGVTKARKTEAGSTNASYPNRLVIDKLDVGARPLKLTVPTWVLPIGGHGGILVYVQVGGPPGSFLTQGYANSSTVIDPSCHSNNPEPKRSGI